MLKRLRRLKRPKRLERIRRRSPYIEFPFFQLPPISAPQRITRRLIPVHFCVANRADILPAGDIPFDRLQPDPDNAADKPTVDANGQLEPHVTTKKIIIPANNLKAHKDPVQQVLVDHKKTDQPLLHGHVLQHQATGDHHKGREVVDSLL